MAKGRKPQGINLQDLMDFLAMATGNESPHQQSIAGEYTKGVRRAFPQAIDAVNRGVIDFVSPLTADELTRLRDSGPDKGHAASLALYAALSKAPAAFRGAKSAYRGTKSLFKNKQAPVGSRTQPKRTATTSMSSTINDPMAQYAAYLAATRR